MQYPKTALTALALAWLSSAAAAAPLPAEFQITGAVSAGTPITSMMQADELLAGQLPAKLLRTGSSPVVNFDNPLNPGVRFHFPNKFVFLTDPQANPNNFAIRATGLVTVPSAGEWSFGVNSDDGFALQVGPFALQHMHQRAPHDTIATFDFPTAGAYPIELTYYQHMDHAEVELFASPGSFKGFHQAGADFQLVGNTGAGGLALAGVPGRAAPAPLVGSPPPTNVPEPAAGALIAIGATLLPRRRRPH